MDLQPFAQPARRDGVVETAGALVARAHRPSRTASPVVRRAGVLHVPVRADGRRPAHRAVQEPAGADRARRARDSPGNVPGSVRGAGRDRLEHRGRAAVRQRPIPPANDRRGRRRVRRGPARGPAPDERGGHRPRSGAAVARAAGEPPGRTGERVPPPAPHVRPVRAVRGTHRPREGLRGTARILSDVRPGRRRRDADADGRQAHAAAGGPTRALRRDASRRGAPARPRRRHRGRRAVAIREPVAARPRGVRRRVAGARQRENPRSSSSTAASATPGCTTQIAGSSSTRSSSCSARSHSASRWAGTASCTSTGTTGGNLILAKYERLFNRVKQSGRDGKPHKR